MLALEDKVSGFDQAKFIADFEAAGGVWIDISQISYHSHDGSHLSRPAAEQLSRDIAKAIHRHQQAATAAGSTHAASPATRRDDGCP
jgi:hypothetical protein